MAKMIGFGAMPLHHVLRHAARLGKSEEHVGADHGFLQRARAGLRGKARLVRVHVLGAALVDHALGVAHHDVLEAHAQADVVRRAGDGGRAGAVEDHLDVFDFLAAEFQRVDQARAADDGRAVLIVVEDRNLHGLAQRLLRCRSTPAP